MNAHTPGPWKYGELSESIIGPSLQPVAQFDYSHGLMAEEEIAANARLIEASPEMADALHGLMRAVDSVTQGQEAELRKEWEPKARALLKRLGRTDGLR